MLMARAILSKIHICIYLKSLELSGVLIHGLCNGNQFLSISAILLIYVLHALGVKGKYFMLLHIPKT